MKRKAQTADTAALGGILLASLLALIVMTSMLAGWTGGAWSAAAQEPPPAASTPTPTVTPAPGWPLVVEATADDGLVLVGDFYLVGHAQPTVLLLHQLYTDRTSWGPVIGPLVTSGYNVLAVDVRGEGATGGAIDWWAAVDDVGVWLAWLRTEAGVRADAISTMGSSMGSSLALIGCAQDPACHTAIAISPGWNYYGLGVHDAFANRFGDRAALLVYAARDAWPARGVPRIVETAANPVTVQEYPGNAHGMMLFDLEADTLIPLLLDWLATH